MTLNLKRCTNISWDNSFIISFSRKKASSAVFHLSVILEGHNSGAKKQSQQEHQISKTLDHWFPTMSASQKSTEDLLHEWFLHNLVTKTDL